MFCRMLTSPVRSHAACTLPPAPGVCPWPQVDVLAKGLKKEAVEVTIEPRRLRVVTSSGEGEGDFLVTVAVGP